MIDGFTPQPPRRVRGRPFEKGRLGNPTGRRVGCRNKTTIAAAALLAGRGHGALGVESTSQRDSAATLPQGGAETALLIVKTPAPSQGSANPRVLDDNPVCHVEGGPARTPRAATLTGRVVIISPASMPDTPVKRTAEPVG
jgi:hypothetical protein